MVWHGVDILRVIALRRDHYDGFAVAINVWLLTNRHVRRLLTHLLQGILSRLAWKDLKFLNWLTKKGLVFLDWLALAEGMLLIILCNYGIIMVVVALSFAYGGFKGYSADSFLMGFQSLAFAFGP